MLVTQHTATIRLIPAIMGIVIRVTVTLIQAMAMAMAVRITALIGAITDALLAELIGDGIAGIKEGVIAPRRSFGSFASSERCADFTYSLLPISADDYFVRQTR